MTTDVTAEILGICADAHDSGDPWGSGLNAGFALCNALTIIGADDMIPASLGYRPSICGPEDPDDDYIGAGVVPLARKHGPVPVLAALAVIEAEIDAIPESDRY